MPMSERSMMLVTAAIVVVVVAATLAYMGTSGNGVPRPNDSAAGALGNFTDASAGLPAFGDYYYVALADLNGDGRDDLVAAAGQNPAGEVDTHGLYVYLSRDGGGWQEASTGLPRTHTFGGVAVADLDGDGRKDLAAPTEGWSDSSDLGVTVWLNKAAPTGGVTWVAGPQPVASGYYHQVVAADVNGDGLPDIVAAGRDDGVRVFTQSRGPGGAINWTDATPGSGLPTHGTFTSVAVADLDLDGHADIAATPYSSASPEVRIFLGDGKGAWTSRSSAMPATSHIPIMVMVADVNRDSHPDLVVSLRDDGLACFLGEGTGAQLAFRSASTGLPTRGAYREVALGDLNGDGELDLLAACMDRGLELYLGNRTAAGPQEWTRVGLHLPEGAYSAAALGDINHDGVLDVAGGQWGSATEGGLRALAGHVTRT